MNTAVNTKPTIPWSYFPLTYRIKKKLLGVPSLAEEASEIQELCPVEMGERPAAIFLEGQLDKVRAAQEETNEIQEMARITAGPVKHESTLAYKIKRAVLINGIIYCGDARIQKVYERENLLPHRIKDHIDNVALPSSVVGNRYFGHFIAEDACAGLMAKDFAPTAWVETTISRTAHAQRYLDIYKLSHREVRTAYIEQGWLFKDFAMNSHKRNRLSLMRQMVRSLPGSRSGHGVFFRRRGSGVARGLINEEAIEHRLEHEGFEIIDITNETVDGIINRVRDASIVVGVEGSALMHGILSMSQNGTVVCIQPPYRFNNVLKDHTDAIGLNYGFIVGEGSETAFKIDEAQLIKTLDYALSISS